MQALYVHAMLRMTEHHHKGLVLKNIAIKKNSSLLTYCIRASYHSERSIINIIIFFLVLTLVI